MLLFLCSLERKSTALKIFKIIALKIYFHVWASFEQIHKHYRLRLTPGTVLNGKEWPKRLFLCPVELHDTIVH